MASALRAQWDVLAGRAWPVWGAAILVATVNVFLFAFDRPWTASDGLRNWGDWTLAGAARPEAWILGAGFRGRRTLPCHLHEDRPRPALSSGWVDG